MCASEETPKHRYTVTETMILDYIAMKMNWDLFEGSAFSKWKIAYVYLFANYDFASFAMPLFFMCCIFLHQFNVYIVHSVGSYINTHSHACTLSHTYSHTHIQTRVLTLYTKSMGRRRRRLRRLCMCTQHINAYQQIHSHHRYTHALHINRLVAILYMIFFFISFLSNEQIQNKTHQRVWKFRGKKKLNQMSLLRFLYVSLIELFRNGKCKKMTMINYTHPKWIENE